MKGVKRNAISLAPHDDAWASEYASARHELMAILGNNLLEIHQVGSTAIKGIVAKPILDIAIVIQSNHRLNIPGMEAAGYEYCGDAAVPGRHFFARRADGDLSTHHVHCYLPGNDNYQSLILFCQYLNVKFLRQNHQKSAGCQLAFRRASSGC